MVMSATPVILLNASALALPSELQGIDDRERSGGARVIVAGSSLVRMTMAELSLPGAQMIWTDFRQSSSLRGLHVLIRDLGGLDRLVLAGDGAEAQEMFSLMCAILTFLPALRARPRARIVLAVQDGPAVASLRDFLNGLAVRLGQDGIEVLLQIDRRQSAPSAA